MRRILGQLLLLIGLLAGSTLPAQAAGPTGGINPCAVLVVCVGLGTPGSTPPPGSTGGSGGGGSGGTADCTWNKMKFPCWDPDLGWFDESDGCYYSLLDPQPAPGDPAWEGNPSTSGAVYNLACHDLKGNNTAPGTKFRDKAPGAGSPPPDPGMVARMALKKLQFAIPVPHTAPAGTALVETPVWFWYDTSADTHEQTVGPQSRTATLGSISVTATATLTDVEWDLGYADKDTHDEAMLSCAGKNGGAGLPYRHELGSSLPEGACYKSFAKASLAGVPAPHGGVPYYLTVTEHWSITTSGAYVETLAFPLSSAPIELRVSELQVLN